jgi:hypothetical protein
VARGWDREGHVAITSVVDVIDTAGGRPTADVGGIAYAGSRGVSRVEVRVDEGEWLEATLRAPLSETTWVVWRVQLPVSQGDHAFAVRAFDGQGQPQTAAFHAKQRRT